MAEPVSLPTTSCPALALPAVQGPPRPTHHPAQAQPRHVGGWAGGWAGGWVSRAASNLALLQTGLAVFAQHLFPGRGALWGAGWSSPLQMSRAWARFPGPCSLALQTPAALWHDIPLGSGVTSSKEPPLTPPPPASLCCLQLTYFLPFTDM